MSNGLANLFFNASAPLRNCGQRNTRFVVLHMLASARGQADFYPEIGIG
jgi:hypothetical protein